MIDFKSRSRELRKKSVFTERVMWRLLRNRRLNKFKFRRQYVIEPFIVDFICISKKLIIELDGEYHQYQQEYDLDRARYLELKGYHVLRFQNEFLFAKEDAVLNAIIEALER